jgi:Bax protein
MKIKMLTNLNKIIYSLLTILALEVTTFSLILVFDGVVNKDSVAIKPSVEQSQQRVTLLANPQKKSIKIVKVEKTTPKLEKALRKISPNSAKDIILLKSSAVEPIVYTKSVVLSSLSIAKKKETFIDLMIPSILLAKYELKEERVKVKKLLVKKELTAKESLWLRKKRYIFKASSNEDLYNKMESHPTSIVIAQAIIESGWGTSKFFEKGNNVFGIWSFNKNEARIPAGKKRGDKRVYLRKYASFSQSISDYFLMLSTKEVYQPFREKRLETQDPFELIKYLTKYSELGDEYIENLKNTIEKNNLLAYDSYHLAF